MAYNPACEESTGLWVLRWTGSQQRCRAVAVSQSSATPSTEAFVHPDNKQEMDGVHKYQNMNGWSSGETAVLLRPLLSLLFQGQGEVGTKVTQ